METPTHKKRFPAEIAILGSLILGLFAIIIASTLWFHFNPPGKDGKSMFSDDPNTTNQVAIPHIPPSE
ncbi:MAG: hypothetical protein LR011_07150 [Verrucomicrobia bacterium]|nr:hypothetical protein [Verrucomicrobiota bacterium]